MMSVDEKCPGGLLIPQRPDRAGQEPERAAGPLEVRDRRQPLVENAHERRMEGIAELDFVRPGRRGELGGEVSAAAVGVVRNRGVGGTDRSRLRAIRLRVSVSESSTACVSSPNASVTSVVVTTSTAFGFASTASMRAMRNDTVWRASVESPT
jgi:hypothetical protein